MEAIICITCFYTTGKEYFDKSFITAYMLGYVKMVHHFLCLQEYFITPSSGQLSTQTPHRIHFAFSMVTFCTIILQASKLIGQLLSHILYCILLLDIKNYSRPRIFLFLFLSVAIPAKSSKLFSGVLIK